MLPGHGRGAGSRVPGLQVPGPSTLLSVPPQTSGQREGKNQASWRPTPRARESHSHPSGGGRSRATDDNSIQLHPNPSPNPQPQSRRKPQQRLLNDHQLVATQLLATFKSGRFCGAHVSLPAVGRVGWDCNCFLEVMAAERYPTIKVEQQATIIPVWPSIEQDATVKSPKSDPGAGEGDGSSPVSTFTTTSPSPVAVGDNAALPRSVTLAAPAKFRGQHPPGLWESLKQEIRHLYIDEELPLKEVREIMMRKGFVAT